jgi:hypothetical protein
MGCWHDTNPRTIQPDFLDLRINYQQQIYAPNMQSIINIILPTNLVGKLSTATDLNNWNIWALSIANQYGFDTIGYQAGFALFFGKYGTIFNSIVFKYDRTAVYTGSCGLFGVGMVNRVFYIQQISSSSSITTTSSMSITTAPTTASTIARTTTSSRSITTTSSTRITTTSSANTTTPKPITTNSVLSFSGYIDKGCWKDDATRTINSFSLNMTQINPGAMINTKTKKMITFTIPSNLTTNITEANFTNWVSWAANTAFANDYDTFGFQGTALFFGNYNFPDVNKSWIIMKYDRIGRETGTCSSYGGQMINRVFSTK